MPARHANKNCAESDREHAFANFLIYLQELSIAHDDCVDVLTVIITRELADREINIVIRCKLIPWLSSFVSFLWWNN